MDPSSSSAPSSTPQKRSGGSIQYFAFCGAGGALASGFTSPLQSLLQYAPRSVSSIGAVTGANRARTAPPMSCFMREGFYRFALYEGFKRLYGSFFGDDGHQLRIPISIFSAMNAQWFANAAFIDRAQLITASGQPLCSCEHHSKELFEKENVYDLRRMRNTMISFPCYEFLTEKLYKVKPKADCSTTEQLLTTFSAAYIAGFTCGLVTHPLDVLPSSRKKEPVGISDKFSVRRFLPRTHAMASVSALQWLIYEGFKLATSADRETTVTSSQKASSRPEMPESLRVKLEEWKQRREQRPTVTSS